MSQLKSVLSHLTIETAKRERICSRHRRMEHHDIQPGERCLVIEGASGYAQNYCVESALEILQRAEADLAALRNSLEVGRLAEPNRCRTCPSTIGMASHGGNDPCEA